MKKTIGGDRLGSGKKMTYETRTFNRSTHELSEEFLTTIAPGTLVPFMVLPALPGDTFDIELNADIRTLPTLGPMFSTLKLQLDVFEIPWRLYIKDMMINKIDIGRNIEKVLIPQIRVLSNNINIGINQPYTDETPWGGKELANCQIEPSTLLSYLGIKGLGWSDINSTTVRREFQGLTTLMYWDIVKQYYSNKMEENAYVIHNPMLEQNGLVDDVRVITNNNQYHTDMNVPTELNINTQLAIILMFAEDWEYNAFNEHSVLIGTSLTNSQPTAVLPLDMFTIQRHDAQKAIYYTQKIPVGNPGTFWLTVKSTERYDFNQPNVYSFPLQNIDLIKDEIMAHESASPFIIDENSLEPYNLMFQKISNTGGFYDITALQCKQEGLALKTYQSDVNNNWLNTEWIDGDSGVNAVTAIATDEEGKFTIDELNIKKKVYEMLNAIALSGGTYDDYQEALWNVERIKAISSPVYSGGLSKEIVFEEVVSQASIPEESQPLGTLAGRGRLGNKHKGGHIVIKTYEPSFIIGIVSITPRVVYSQGNSWFNNLLNLSELHNPYMDNIGFQDLVTDTMGYFDTMLDGNGVQTYKSAGKQPSWINYQTSINKVFGNFALENEQMFMIFNRRYDGVRADDGWQIGDLTTYINPSKYNYIFADTSPDAMNFWLQIVSNITARRVMSANQIPNP